MQGCLSPTIFNYFLARMFALTHHPCMILLSPLISDFLHEYGIGISNVICEGINRHEPIFFIESAHI